MFNVKKIVQYVVYLEDTSDGKGETRCVGDYHKLHNFHIKCNYGTC